MHVYLRTHLAVALWVAAEARTATTPTSSNLSQPAQMLSYNGHSNSGKTRLRIWRFNLQMHVCNCKYQQTIEFTTDATISEMTWSTCLGLRKPRAFWCMDSSCGQNPIRSKNCKIFNKVRDNWRRVKHIIIRGNYLKPRQLKALFELRLIRIKRICCKCGGEKGDKEFTNQSEICCLDIHRLLLQPPKVRRHWSLDGGVDFY